ncbi:hypothetical protein EV178_001084 [Coemansia sp. RSA 1646]|nr:hypothetical protein EV178_001084 [Coemansia sp. RSA 1646]
MARSTKQESPLQSPTGANAQARSSLGLFAGTGGSPVKSPAGAAAKSPMQRNITVTGATTPTTHAPPPQDGEERVNIHGLKESDRRRRRAARRQSEDTMHAMRSLDRQYGRRRRLNSDFHENDGSGKYNAVEVLGDLTAHKSLGGGANNGRPSSKRGDSRMLFAPALCRPHAETVTAFAGRPPSSVAAKDDDVNDAPDAVHPVATSRRSAHQLMLLAGRMAKQQQQQQQLHGAGRLAVTASSIISATTGVRPRASMPLINGVPHRPPQRMRSQATRKHRDEELSDALTMKSVEIRGGRIVLDNPSSSEESDGEHSDSADSFVAEGRGGDNEVEVSRLFGNQHRHHRRHHMGSTNTAPTAMGGPETGSIGTIGASMAQRLSIGSSVCSTQSADVSGAWAWDEALRRQWYTRRCLGLRQSFDSVHRLVKAEHDSQAPFPLLNDLRRVLVETHGCALRANNGDPEPVDVLLCTDSIVVCAACQQQESEPIPLRAIEFSDDLVVRVMESSEGSDRAVCITGEEDNPKQQLVLEFPNSGGARVWVEQVVQTRTRLSTALQDLRLDEEDYVDHPPIPLLARGRNSIAGTTADNASLGTVGHVRMRNAAHGGVYWVPDGETSVCMVCQKTVFSMMVRRHHCRGCGLIICYRCSAVDSSRRRMCVRCGKLRKGRPMPATISSSVELRPTAASTIAVDADVSPSSSTAVGPRQSPSLMTLGRRAAEYLPAGDVVMQLAVQHESGSSPSSSAADTASTDPPLVHKKADRLARRPISSLFPLVAELETNASNNNNNNNN